MSEYKLNSFDLQLCNDGEPAPSVPVTQPVETASVVEEKPQITDFNSLSKSEQVDFFEQFNKPKQPIPAPQPEQPKEPVVEEQTPPVDVTPVEPETPPVVPYTPEEITSTGIDKLDPARLPEELKPYYKSMLADYTRKTQAIAEQKKQAEQVQQPQIEQKQKAIDRILQERAQDIAHVEAILNEGNTGEKILYDEWDDGHRYIMKRVSDYRVMQEQQHNSVISKGERFIQQEKLDPDFQNMYAHAEKELVALAGSGIEGFNLANRIMEANNKLGTQYATDDDIELVQTFWNNTKTKYRQTKTKPVVPQAPPPKMPVATEQTGVSVNTETKPKKFNPNNVKNMNKDQLKELFGVFANK